MESQTRDDFDGITTFFSVSQPAVPVVVLITPSTVFDRYDTFFVSNYPKLNFIEFLIDPTCPFDKITAT